MKRFGWILVLLMTASPTWAAKKMTVQQLKDLLGSLQRNHGTDVEVATRLKQIDLSEELTAAVKSDLLFASPGPLTSEQICVLDARSSMLAPPPSDQPNLPIPDSLTQKSIVDKAIDIATKNDQRISHLTAMKAVSRYGHLVTVSNWQNLDATANLQSGDESIMYLTSKYTETVEIDQGIEKVSTSRVDPSLKRISPISEGGMRPAISQFLRQANDGGNIHWLRWETINGARTAVFSFTIDKRKAFYGIDYCCFPTLREVSGYDWKPFKKTVGLHGEFFIDPDNGTMLRIVMQAEFNPTDFVEREDTRIDYGMVTIGDSTYLLPMGSYTHTEMDISGESKKAYINRRTFLVASYAKYRMAGSAQR
ncbi:MAG: hypothetical protein WAN35_05380 [Terracidiphilus sp.]